MRQYNSLSEVTLKHSRLTIGAFDGVHIGHQAIVHRLIESARLAGSSSVVLTFHPHPAKVLGRRTGAYTLTTPEERVRLLDDFGVDIVIVKEFTPLLAETSAADFVKSMLSSLNFQELWVGNDFALGHNREGTVPFLREYGKSAGFTVNVVEPVFLEGEVVSSSRIRNSLSSGEISKVNQLLGWHYEVTGKVVPGDQRGRTIGIPTANLEIDPEKIIPSSGVYACWAYLGNTKYPAATNIGVRPTFDGNKTSLQIETHILNFSADIYNKDLRLVFLERLRGEERFPSVDALVSQIHLDIRNVRQITSVVEG